MGDYERILVANDFSANAASAQETAIGLAQRLDAEVHVVFVYPPPLDLLTTFGVEIPRVSLPELRRSAAVRLDQELAKVRSAGLEGAWHFREGEPADELVATAAEIGADLIVMGTRGRTGLAHTLLGSVAERTLRKSECPVLTVRTPHHPES